jgi:hypothetical protein
VLQDQGFRVTTSDARLGVIAGRKPRADEEIVSDVFRQALLAGITLGLHPDLTRNPPDGYGVVVATRSVGGSRQSHQVRVTFYLSWGLLGLPSPAKVSGAQAITSPELYQRFFAMLGTTLARARSGG